AIRARRPVERMCRAFCQGLVASAFRIGRRRRALDGTGAAVQAAGNREERSSMPAILYDQTSNAYRMGTGIATYARNLAQAARAAGYGADALVSADVAIDPANPVLSEVQLFDVRPDPALPWLGPALGFVRGVVRGPFG